MSRRAQTPDLVQQARNGPSLQIECSKVIISREQRRYVLRQVAHSGYSARPNQARVSGWALSFPRQRESTVRRWTLHWIPAFAGMAVSLTRGGAGRMLAKKAGIEDLARHICSSQVANPNYSRGFIRGLSGQAPHRHAGDYKGRPCDGSEDGPLSSIQPEKVNRAQSH